MRVKLINLWAIVICILFVAVLLANCSTLGLNSPETTKQRLVYAYGTLQGIYETTSDYYKAGLISKEAAVEIVKRGKQTETILGTAEKFLEKEELKDIKNSVIKAREDLEKELGL